MGYGSQFQPWLMAEGIGLNKLLENEILRVL